MHELVLGNVTYSEEQLRTIMAEGDSNNGLILLAEQLAPAKLNVANGAGHTCIDMEISQADLIIGDLIVPPFGQGFIPPGNVTELVLKLTRYCKGDECCALRCDTEESK